MTHYHQRHYAGIIGGSILIKYYKAVNAYNIICSCVCMLMCSSVCIITSQNDHAGETETYF